MHNTKLSFTKIHFKLNTVVDFNQKKATPQHCKYVYQWLKIFGWDYLFKNRQCFRRVGGGGAGPNPTMVFQN